MNIKEEIIERYFKSWLDNDESILSTTFAQKIIYIESFGPAYEGLSEIYMWFNDWHKYGKVLTWNIKQFIHYNDVTVCEWYFRCSYEGKIEGFEGVSLITFNKDNKIIRLKEFQSKVPNYYPYK